MASESTLAALARSARLKTLPLALFPVALGAAAAVGERIELDGVALALSVLVVGSMHVAGVLITDLFDHRAGTDKLARLDRSAIPTGSLPLEEGTIQPRALRVAVVALLGVACAGTAAIGVTRAWWLLGAAIVLAVSYAGPPLRLAYVGMGLGDAALLACYGPLAVSGSYAAMTGWTPPASLLLASVALGGLIAMSYASHHFLHWRADRAATKRTIVVSLGEHGALVVIGVVDVVAWAALGGVWFIGDLSWVLFLGTLGMPVVWTAWRSAWSDPLPQAYLRLIGAHLAAVAIATLALVSAFATAKPVG